MQASKATQAKDHSDGAGLYLRVTKAGTKSWIFKYRGREMGLGGFPAIGLADARGKAKAAREMLANGEDPIEVKRRGGIATAKGMNFAEAAERYISAFEKSWRPDRARRWRGTMRDYALPVIGKLPVSAIEVRHIMQILQPVWSEKTPAATKARTRIEKVLDWCKAQGLRSGENPARWQANLQYMLPKRKDVHTTQHRPAMPYEQVPAFMAELAANPTIPARALTLLILTASRREEVFRASWSEFDGSTWLIPAGRMKGRQAHRIPLSIQAQALLNGLPRMDDERFLFPSVRRGSPITATRPAALLPAGVTLHGFRSSFRDWAAEQTSFPREVAEAALSHKIGQGQTERSYLRTDLFEKRRSLMQAWADYCLSSGENVIPLRRNNINAADKVSI